MRTVAFDIDGVLCDLHTPWLKRYNYAYDDDLEFEDIRDWDWAKFTKCDDVCRLLDPSIYDESAAVPGALEAVRVARTYGRVVFATGPMPKRVPCKFDWLAKNGFEPRNEDYIECDDKSLVRADLLVDDYPKNLYRFCGAAILFSRPWNRDAEDLHRIESFDDFDRHLDLQLATR